VEVGYPGTAGSSSSGVGILELGTHMLRLQMQQNVDCALC